MRLERLDLTRYGKFTFHSLDFGKPVAGTPDLHIVYGLNEAGKSTALSAWLDLLFEIENQTAYSFLHQGPTMEIGARLEFGGKVHEFRRVKQRSNSLLDANGQPVNEAVLSVPLAGLTRSSYQMMFSLDDQTLEEGGKAILESKGDLGELLFSASTGLAGINAVLQASADEADAIFRKRASKTGIAGLKREIAELKSRRDEIDIQTSEHRKRTTELAQTDTAYGEVMRDIAAAKIRQEEIARILRAYPLLADLHRIIAEFQAFEDLPHPPAEWAALVGDLIAQDTRLQTRMDDNRRKEEKIRAELEGLAVNETLLDLAGAVDQLSALKSRFETAEKDLPKRKAALAEWTRRCDHILAALGRPDVEDARTLLVPAAIIGTLRDLIAKKSGLDVALQTAEKEYEAARQSREKAALARQALDGQSHAMDAGRLALIETVLDRLRQGALVAEHRLAMCSLPDRQQVFDHALAALHPWNGDGDALRTIAPIPASRRDSWKSALSAIDRKRAKYDELESSLATRLDEEKARLVALHAIGGVIGDEEARASLSERDEAWARHLAAMDNDSAHIFEEKMRHADAVATARLDKARQVEELRALSAALEVTKAGLLRQREVLTGIDVEYEALRREINAEIPAEIGLSTDAPLAAWLARIETWEENRTSALVAWDDLQRALRAVETSRTALEAEQASLVNALAAIGIVADDLPLMALLQAAETALTGNREWQSRRIEAVNRLGELDAALAERHKERERTTASFEKWRQAWLGALGETWFAERHDSAGAVKELLDTVSPLPEALREQDELGHRIGAMEADRQAFIEAVGELNTALGNPFDGMSAQAAARAIIGLHEEMKKLVVQRQERQQALVDLSSEKEELAGEMALLAARRSEMSDLLDAGTLIEIRDVLERCRERDILADQKRKAEQQLIAEMQLQSLDEAMAALAKTDLSALRHEQAELAARLDDLEGRSKELFADRALASNRLNAIDGDDAVARIEARRRTILLEMEELALRYLRLKTGSMVAGHALHAYRDRHRSAMMNRASEAFRQITRGEYARLATRPEKDRESLIGITRQGSSKEVSAMSKGTRFQLYLALRLAGYEEFAAARPSVPFIADDIMETFDEPRSEEVFKLFAHMAHVGQVIYLTHHRHLCEIARKVVPAVRIHEIS